MNMHENTFQRGITIRVNQRVYDVIKKLADGQGVSISAWVRDVIDMELAGKAAGLGSEVRGQARQVPEHVAGTGRGIEVTKPMQQEKRRQEIPAPPVSTSAGSLRKWL